ncbi:MAG: hypothetical protein K6G88_03250 [Lachnospiraceae bacterium]|nr:hypothetical protein [Lachnospiraceae bacterium]
MKNRELKLYAASKGVRLWQVAEKFGITDAAFSRKLRKEFSREDAEQFKKYVDEISSEKGGAVIE